MKNSLEKVMNNATLFAKHCNKEVIVRKTTTGYYHYETLDWIESTPNWNLLYPRHSWRHKIKPDGTVENINEASACGRDNEPRCGQR